MWKGQVKGGCHVGNRVVRGFKGEKEKKIKQARAPNQKDWSKSKSRGEKLWGPDGGEQAAAASERRLARAAAVGESGLP